MLRHIDIAMTPADALLLPPADCYLVIDTLRATTTIATLFARGLARLTVVSSIDQALAMRDGDVLLFGESGGLRPDGFDFGNSPVETAGLDLVGRNAVLVTSNGTVALCAVAPRGVTVAASLANLSAVADFAAMDESALIVCSGNGGATRFSLEDFAVGAALVQALADTAGDLQMGDGAVAGSRVVDPEALIGSGSHASILRSLGLAPDVDFAASPDSSFSVPRVTSFGDGWAELEDHAHRVS